MTRARAVHRPGLLRRALPVLLLGGVLAGWLALQLPPWPWFTVQEIRLEAPLAQAPLASYTAVLAPQLGRSLLAIEPAVLATALREHEALRTVQVERRWPHALRVVAHEVQPVARWGEVALLDVDGSRIAAAASNTAVELPLLNGPPGSEREVLATWAELGGLLARHALQISQLVVDERGSWRLTLGSGVELRLGGEVPAPQRLAAFLQRGWPVLAADSDRLAYVDLRYPNGFAVAPRQAAPVTVRNET